MKWRRSVPTCFTLMILLLGFQSILKSIEGEFIVAAQLIVLAAIVDGLDGEVARLFRGITTFGAKLDTYVDTVSFGVAPAILVYQVIWRDYEFWGALVTSAIVVSAVIRFARYSYKESRVGHHSFKGLPIPVSAVWMSMFVLLTETNMLGDAKAPLESGPLSLVMWACAIAFLVLQISNVRYAKPTKEMIGFGLLAAVPLMVLTGRPVMIFCVGTCVALLLFAFFGPLVLHAGGGFEEDADGEEEPVKLRHF